MLLERIYDEDLAQASFVIGCQAQRQAIVVDPRRDVAVYLDIAEKNGMEIVGVTETHIHADYLSGTRELAAATGATMYVSGEGGQDWQYEYEATRLYDGSTITLGNITVTAVHSPGHTPEHLSFLITDGAFAEDPGYILTGDFVFSGDLGRPDLLDEAAGGVDTRFRGARQMFKSLQEKFLTLPDHVQVFPGHGAGSACGKALGAIPSTTVGYERRFSWWAPYLENNDEQGFIDELLDGQPDAPFYFGRMKNQNRRGPEIMGERTPLEELDNAEVARKLETNEISFVDTRSADAVHRGTVEGALNIPGSGNTATFGAWAVNPDTDDRPLVLLAQEQETAQSIWDHLVRVGIDKVAGYVTSLEGLPVTEPQVITPGDLDSFDPAMLLDVRAVSEHNQGNIPGSTQLHGGRVLWNLDRLPEDGSIVTYCKSGARSSVVANALRHAGYDVTELKGSYDAWATHQRSLSNTMR